MNSNSLNVLIVGCGNIAGIFDHHRSDVGPPLTHAGAYSRDPRFCITACIEPVDNRRREFMERLRVPKEFCATMGL